MRKKPLETAVFALRQLLENVTAQCPVTELNASPNSFLCIFDSRYLDRSKSIANFNGADGVQMRCRWGRCFEILGTVT
jgi:hypothetical protein